MIRRRAARRDNNERPIIDALTSVGASVWQLSETGVADILVGFAGLTHVVEVKAEGKRKKLTPAQEKTLTTWRGSPIHVVETVAEALAVIGVMPARESRPWTPEERAELIPPPRQKK